MPVKFEFDAPEKAYEDFITIWVNQLADNNFEKAYEDILHDEYYGLSPALIESVINGYGLEYEQGNKKFEVTKTFHALGEGSSFDVMWYDPETVTHFIEGQRRLAEIWYQLPLNNEWSDLTVTFDIIMYPEGLYLMLKEIHVF